MLALGVAHNLEIWQILLHVATKKWTTVYFYVLIISIIMPAASVLSGRWLVTRAGNYGDNCLRQLSSVYKSKITNLPVPVVPPVVATVVEPESRPKAPEATNVQDTRAIHTGSIRRFSTASRPGFVRHPRDTPPRGE